MSRAWAIRKGLNPIFYISAKAPISRSIFQVVRWAGKDTLIDESQDMNEKIYKHTNFILAHTKALSGEVKVDGEIVKKKFYQENEWRYVPKDEGVHALISSTKFANPKIRSRFNKKLKSHAVLSFKPNDIRYLFVKNEEDVRPLITFINRELKRIPLADRRTLMTRIIRLKDIRKDL